MTTVSFLNYSGAIVVTCMLMVLNGLNFNVVGFLIWRSDFFKFPFDPVDFNIPWEGERLLLATGTDYNLISNGASRCECFAVLGQLVFDMGRRSRYASRGSAFLIAGLVAIRMFRIVGGGTVC